MDLSEGHPQPFVSLRTYSDPSSPFHGKSQFASLQIPNPSFQSSVFGLQPWSLVFNHSQLASHVKGKGYWVSCLTSAESEETEFILRQILRSLRSLGRTGEGAGTAAGVARCFVFPRLGVFVIFVIKV